MSSAFEASSARSPSAALEIAAPGSPLAISAASHSGSSAKWVSRRYE